MDTDSRRVCQFPLIKLAKKLKEIMVTILALGAWFPLIKLAKKLKVSV